MQRKTLTRKAEATKTQTSAGRLMARSGVDAVNATERLICRDGAVEAAAVAQGLALAGKRAATLLAGGGSKPPAHIEQCRIASWVHHQIGGGQGAVCGCMAFALDAGSAQEAVDHCLVAHRMADRLALPGHCSLDPAIAEGLHLLRIPSTVMITELLGEADARATTEDVAAAAAEAFEFVSKLTGRERAAVRQHRMDDAEHVLVVSGSSWKRACKAAEELRESGIACGVLAIMMKRPFPEDQVLALLGKDHGIAVENELRADLRSTLGSGSSTRLRRLAEVGAEEAAATLGLKFEPTPEFDEELQSVMIGVSPGGPWGDMLLLDGAALLGRLTHFNLNRPPHRLPGMSALALGEGGPKDEVDLLFAADPSLLGSDDRLLELIRDGGLLVFGTRGESPQEVGAALGEDRLRQITERKLKVSCFDLLAAAGHEDSSAETTRTLLLGALLAAGDEIAGPIGHEGKVVKAITASAENDDLAEDFISLLHEGAAALRTLDPADMQEPDIEEELDFKPRKTLPTMPVPSGAELVEDWAGELRRFHLTGLGAYSDAEPLASLPLMPAGLGPLAEIDRRWRDYPLVLSEEKGTVSLTELLDMTLDDIEQSGGDAGILREHRGRLSRAAGRILEGKGPMPFREILDEACELFGDELDLSDAGAAELEEQIYKLKSRLPEAHSMIGLGKETLLRLYEATVRAERGPQAAFRDEIKKRIAQMEELLLADRVYSDEGSSADALAAAIGESEHDLLDLKILAESLPDSRGSTGLEPTRRERIEKALATMRGYLEVVKIQPPFILFHHGQLIGAVQSGAQVVEHPDGLEAAIGLFDGLASRLTEVLRAVRVARLEHDGRYDPGRHDALLSRFDWRAFDEDEFSLLPPIVVLESGRRLRGWAAASLSSLLRSGRPIHVLAVECIAEPDCDENADGLVDIHPGFGFFAISHREAFVLQSTLAYPHHLVDGLKRMMRVPRPAISLVAEPAWESPISPWMQLSAAHSGRGTPIFKYDADAGLTWAECFDLGGNPQPELAWPVRETRIADASGEEKTLEEAFTFVHSAALEPAYRSHFRVIPTEAWNQDQLEISAYLAAAPEERRRKVPYIWITGRDGRLARAVMTLEMLLACGDRMRTWRILQELGGADNEYARRAAEAARQQALAEAEEARKELEAEHHDEVERARATAAGEAMERLVGVLMNEDALAGMAPAPAAMPAAAPAAAEAVDEVVEEKEAEEEEEEAISFADPYITSALCTTCNECTNLNSRMFQYNANKQAFISDPKAGTFAELVKAAEKCPARCIHPGAPREDDDTVTEDLIAKAAQFN
jgi:hypothetical protein